MHRYKGYEVKAYIAIFVFNAKRHLLGKKVGVAEPSFKFEGIQRGFCGLSVEKGRYTAVKPENAVFALTIGLGKTASDTAFNRVASHKHFTAEIAKRLLFVYNIAAGGAGFRKKSRFKSL